MSTGNSIKSMAATARDRVDALPAVWQASVSAGLVAVVWVTTVGLNSWRGSHQPPGDLVVTLLVVTAVALLYIVPSIVADRRHVPNAARVRIVNLALGWTVIGWLVALGMALASRRG